MAKRNPLQMSFWDEDAGGLFDALATLLLEIYLDGIDGGIEVLPASLRVLVNWDLVNTKALEFARTYRYTWIKRITDTTRQQTQKAMADWIQSGAPLDALEKALEPIFGSVRASMIAQTETTRVFAQANREAWEASGLVEEWEWRTVQEEGTVCPICEELNGQHFGIGDIDALMPAHINCRCFAIPLVSEKALESQLDKILT